MSKKRGQVSTVYYADLSLRLKGDKRSARSVLRKEYPEFFFDESVTEEVRNFPNQDNRL